VAPPRTHENGAQEFRPIHCGHQVES
jgi:hypothetical protein